MKINRLWMLVAASVVCVPSSLAQYGVSTTTQQSTQNKTVRNITQYRSPSNKAIMLRGGVAKTPVPYFGPGNARFVNNFALSQTRIGPAMVDPSGQTSTMVPADWVPMTGYIGPNDGGASYSPAYAHAVRNYLGRIRLDGPLSTYYSGPSLLRPQSVLVHDVLVNGCPQRASGAVIMEAPGYFDRSGNLIARRKTTVHEYVAAKKTVSKRKGAAM